MAEYHIRNEIGGSVIVKVEAESLDKALELAADLVIDDWNDAGSLKFSDVRQQVIDPTEFDSSIYQNDEGYYAIAKDDPQYYPEIDGDE
ncbi:MAG TPA: hypothetical protein VFX15_03130 [Actinomycetes bacterium]|nr:hypothetical protein [Actinomycetes bacterium]